MTLEDDRPYKVASVGVKMMRMFDGVIRILTKVHHTPKLSKNLVSLDYLERKEYRFDSYSRSRVLSVS